MSGELAMRKFLNSLSPLPSTREDVSLTLVGISQLSRDISSAVSLVSGWDDDTTKALLEQMISISRETNSLETKIKSSATQLRWFSSKCAEVIAKAQKEKSFSPKLAQYLCRKSQAFQPVDFATDLAYLGDQVTAICGELGPSISAVEKLLVSLQNEINSSREKLSKAKTRAHKTAVLKAVNEFVTTACQGSSTILDTAAKSRQMVAKEGIQADLMKVKGILQTFPSLLPESASEPFKKIQDASDRQNKVSEPCLRDTMTSEIPKLLSLSEKLSSSVVDIEDDEGEPEPGLAGLRSKLSRGDKPKKPSTSSIELDNLKMEIDRLANERLPLYKDHLLPKLEVLQKKVRESKNVFLDMSSSWVTHHLNMEDLEKDFKAWRDDPYIWSELLFVKEMDKIRLAWNDLSSLISQLTSGNESAGGAMMMTTMTNFSRGFAISRSTSTSASNSSSKVMFMTAVSKAEVTSKLISNLMVTESSSSHVSLPQTSKAIQLHFSEILSHIGTMMDEPMELSKQGNLIDTSVTTLVTTVEYFVTKMESYLPKMKGKMSTTLGTLNRKLESVITTTPTLTNQVTGAYSTCDHLSTVLTEKVESQEKALAVSLKEFESQKQELEQKKSMEIEKADNKRKTKKKPEEEIQRLGECFKRMLRGGTFSKKTLEEIAEMLGISSVNDQNALDQTQASLEQIDRVIQKAQDEKMALKNAKASIVGAQASLSQLKISLALFLPILQEKQKLIQETIDTISEEQIDWDDFNAHVPDIVSNWKHWYNFMNEPRPPPGSLGMTNPYQSWMPPKPLANAIMLKKRGYRVYTTKKPTRSKHFKSYGIPEDKGRSGLLLFEDAPPATSPEHKTPASAQEAREVIKNALAPAEGALTTVKDIASDVKLIQDKLESMLAKLASSAACKDLCEKVANFKKKFNELETEAKKLATKIYWFAVKNITVLEKLKKHCEANTLSEATFKKLVGYLQRKVQTFISDSSSMSTAHKDLKTDMSVIEGALVALENDLNVRLPALKQQLSKAEDELSSEKDKQKRSAILKAVGGLLSSFGSGGGVFASISGNAAVGGLSGLAAVASGAINFVAGLIGGDENKISQLQNSINQMQAQIPDMESALSAMQPCIQDSKIIQETLDHLSQSWQNVANDLVYINEDYKSWLQEGFDPDDFMLDVDGNLEKWQNICKILQNFADSKPDGENGEPLPVALDYPMMTTAPPPSHETFMADLEQFKRNLTTTASTTSSFANAVQEGCKNCTKANIKEFIIAIQGQASQANDAISSLTTEGQNVVDRGTILTQNLTSAIAQFDRISRDLQEKIDRYNNRSFWDKVKDTFESFGSSVVNIGSGDFGAILHGLGTIVSPVYGVTMGAINSIQDAERAVSSCRNEMRNLEESKNTYNQLLKEAQDNQKFVIDLGSSINKLLRTVTELKLNVAPQVIWDDFETDRLEIESQAKQTLDFSNFLLQKNSSGELKNFMTASVNGSSKKKRPRTIEESPENVRRYRI